MILVLPLPNTVWFERFRTSILKDGTESDLRVFLVASIESFLSGDDFLDLISDHLSADFYDGPTRDIIDHGWDNISFTQISRQYYGYYEQQHKRLVAFYERYLKSIVFTGKTICRLEKLGLDYAVFSTRELP